MATKLGLTFSDHFGVDETWLNKKGVFNPSLDVDAPLFIDPFLLPESKHKEFSACAFDTYESHFTEIMGLLVNCHDQGDKVWNAALKRFQFGESRGMGGTCLGYSTTPGGGRGWGKVLSARALRWAKEVIDLGVKDPELFSSVSLFESGIGPDLISDMITNIALDCIITFNDRIYGEIESELGVKVPRRIFTLRNRQTNMPGNPFSDEPVILLAADILKHLPLLDDPLGLSGLISHNEDLRDRVNSHLGEIFKIRTKKEKENVKAQAMASAESFQAFLDIMKLAEKTPYDIAHDPQGIMQWINIAKDFTAIFKHKIDVDENCTGLDKINSVCKSIITQFANLVENNRLWRVFYVNDKPRPERFSQLLFFAVASSYCEANGLDVSPESDAGAGPVDFKISSGNEKVVVEIKLSTNTQVVKGYQKQLEAYRKAEGAKRGHFVLIDVGHLGGSWKKIQDIRLSDPGFAKINEVHLIDGSIRSSASKLP